MAMSSSDTQVKLLEPYLQEIWEAHRDTSQTQLALVEQAIADAVDGRLTADRREIAAREAHTLCGAVGSLGFADASERLRDVENALVGGGLEVHDAVLYLASLGACRDELFGAREVAPTLQHRADGSPQPVAPEQTS
jgi:chemotaxis protein histidine kinase CheA